MTNRVASIFRMVGLSCSARAAAVMSPSHPPRSLTLAAFPASRMRLARCQPTITKGHRHHADIVVSCNTPDRTPQGSQIRHIVELQLTDADIERQREDRGIPPVEEVALYGYFPLYMVPSGLLQEFRSRGVLTDTAIGTQFRGYRAVRLEPPAEVAQLLEILMEKRARDYIAMRNAGLL